jgi:serine/threonine-protein kinase
MHQRYEDPLQGLKRPRGAPPFDSWLLLDTKGRPLARWPIPSDDYLKKEFGWRDYFLVTEQRALEGPVLSYISRAFVSEVDGKSYRFAIAAPVLGPQGEWLAVLLALPGTGSTLGALHLNNPDGAPHRTAMLVAPRDRNRDEAGGPLPEDYIVLLHDALEHGDSRLLDAETTRQLNRMRHALPSVEGDQLRIPESWPDETATQYRDPLAKDEERSWLAAFAPVGHTGFAVIVETRADMALAGDKVLAQRLMRWGVLFLLGEVLLGLLLWSFWRSGVRWRVARER